jgi:hypothetical protein
VALKLYEDFIKANPWPVEFDNPVKPKVEDYCKKHPTVVGILKEVVSKLGTFPPDPNYFDNPKPSLHDMRIWLTKSDGSLRFMLKVEYRLNQKTCFIVDFLPKS